VSAAPEFDEAYAEWLAAKRAGQPSPWDAMFDVAFLDHMLGADDDDDGFSTPGIRKLGGRPRGSLGQTSIAIREAVLDQLVPSYDRMTVRQVFYKAEVAGIVEKTEAGYQQVQKQLLAMRREGLLDWAFITDGTRWRRRPDMWRNVRDYVDEFTTGYRRDLWQSQGVRIEIWLEKEALADTITDVCWNWGVSLMPSKGQSSATFLYSAAMEAREAYDKAGIETFVYALYDHDMGGQRASNAIERWLPEHAPGVPIHFERIAVTLQQITAWSLPTRPPKATDPQAKKWGNKPAVELDAIDPHQLNALVESAITRHVNHQQWQKEKAVEDEERRGLRALRDGLAGNDTKEGADK
jgi:hypothetical protein